MFTFRRGGTLPTSLTSEDSCKLSCQLTLAGSAAAAAAGASEAASHSTSSLLYNPAWSPWLGIYAPLCQATLMNCFQDAGRVLGVHLTDVSTSSYKSLFMLAAICSLLTALPGSSWGRVHGIHVARGNSSF